jgi:hypothetical protein
MESRQLLRLLTIVSPLRRPELLESLSIAADRAVCASVRQT